MIGSALCGLPVASTRDLRSQTMTPLFQLFSFSSHFKAASAFRRVGTTAHPCRCVPTVEDFFVSGYDHASSTVSGAICRGTISVDLEVTMTYFLDGSLGLFELDDLMLLMLLLLMSLILLLLLTFWLFLSLSLSKVSNKNRNILVER